MATTPWLSNMPPASDLDGLVVDQNYNFVAESMQMQRTVVTPAQLLNLVATPVLLVPAPGPGLVIDVHTVSMKLVYAGTAYVLGTGTLSVFQGPPANAIALTAAQQALLTATATSSNIGIPALATGVKTSNLLENQAILLGNNGGANFTAGNSPLTVMVTYLVYST